MAAEQPRAASPLQRTHATEPVGGVGTIRERQRQRQRQRRRRRHRTRLEDRLGLFGGGMIGTLMRVAVTDIAGDMPGELGWGTLAVNVVGSFLLGLLLARWVRDDLEDRALKVLHTSVATGVLGAFTTFSAFAVELVHHAETDPVLAVVLGFSSVALGLAAALAGMKLGSPRTREAPA